MLLFIVRIQYIHMKCNFTGIHVKQCDLINRTCPNFNGDLIQLPSNLGIDKWLHPTYDYVCNN